jgi:hypothetical protein
VVISGLGQAEVTQAAKTLSDSRAVGVAADNAAPRPGTTSWRPHCITSAASTAPWSV